MIVVMIEAMVVSVAITVIVIAVVLIVVNQPTMSHESCFQQPIQDKTHMKVQTLLCES